MHREQVVLVIIEWQGGKELGQKGRDAVHAVLGEMGCGWGDGAHAAFVGL